MAKKNNPAYRDVGSAGQNFLAFHIEDIIENFNMMESDRDYKKQKIDEYFKGKKGFEDKDDYNVQIRVNAAMRIVRKGLVTEALSLIDGTSEKVLPESVEKAKDIFNRIERGEIKLP